MPRRHRLRWFLTAVFGLTLVVFGGPYVYWGIVGWHKGERFYAGLPSSYWSGQVRSWARHKVPFWAKSLPQRVQDWLGLAGRPSLLAGNPGAVPVLLELLRPEYDESFLVSMEARRALEETKEPPAECVPTLVALLDSEESLRRLLAAELLGRIGSEARAAVPALRGRLDEGNDLVRDAVVKALRRIDPATPVEVRSRVKVADPDDL